MQRNTFKGSGCNCARLSLEIFDNGGGGVTTAPVQSIMSMYDKAKESSVIVDLSNTHGSLIVERTRATINYYSATLVQ